MLLTGITESSSIRVIKMSNQNKSYELTTAQLKKYEGFENVTEDEAKEIIFQLKELSFILYGIFQNQQKENDKGLSEA